MRKTEDVGSQVSLGYKNDIIPRILWGFFLSRRLSRQNGGLTRVFYFSSGFVLLFTNFSGVCESRLSLVAIIFSSCTCNIFVCLIQEGFLYHLGRPSRREQESSQASVQKVSDEVAPG